MMEMVAGQNNGAQASLSGKLKNHADDREQDEAQLSEQSEGQRRSTYSPYDIPREGHAAIAHTFTSDIDQQKLIKELRSDVDILREELKSLSKRIEILENE
jgi:hypothetical protein